jgi:L-aspartate oxidase
MREQQLEHVWLDLRPVGRPKLEQQFPTILGRCRELGLEPTTTPIPVAPAAHYWMGGVRTTSNAATTLPGLYAVGEVASTGVHGANRLASNSLMECLVFARQLRELNLPAPADAPEPSEQSLSALPVPTGEQFRAMERKLQELRRLCWQAAGVEREATQLRHALIEARHLQEPISADPWLQATKQLSTDRFATLDTTEAAWITRAHDLLQRLVVTNLLLEAALFREESRGGHFRVDAPAAQPFWRRHTVQQRAQPIATEAVAAD